MTIMMMIIEMLSALLALCERNTQVDGEFPYKWPVMWNVDVLVWCQPGRWHYVTVMPLRIKISFRRYCDWIHNWYWIQNQSSNGSSLWCVHCIWLITLMRSLFMAHHFDAFIVYGSSLWCVHCIWLITMMRSLYMAHHFDAFIVYGSSLRCVHCIWLITMMRSLYMAHHFDAFIVYGSSLRCVHCINSLRLSDAYMRQQDKPSLVQDNGLSPDRHQAIIWTNADSL